jgi:hypothetical protein
MTFLLGAFLSVVARFISWGSYDVNAALWLLSA